MRQLLAVGVGCLLSLAGTFALPAEVRAQACPNTDYTLTTQAEVDAFPSGCSEVSGELRISGPDITDLSPLSALTAVGTDLWIRDNTALTNLEGLSALSSVGGKVEILDNAALTNLDGLSGITATEGLWIENSEALTDISGLSALTFVGGNLGIVRTALTDLSPLSALTAIEGLWIENNDALTDINALAGITAVGGSVWIDNNHALTDINGLAGITAVGTDLWIRGNTALTNLDGLSALTSVGGDLVIESNHSLTNLNDLSALTFVGRGLGIVGNNALTDLSSLSALTAIEGLEIFRNHALTNLDGLSALSSVVGSLNILENAALTNLDGLSGITGVETDLWIRDNTALTNLDGLSGISSVGDLLLENNDALTDISALSGITAVGGELFISNNDALTNLNGLSGISSVVWRLFIDGNALTDINGLSGITAVGENLWIGLTPALTNLNGLSGISSVGGRLEIVQNAALTNLDGLSALTAVGDLLTIAGNPALTTLDGLSALTAVGDVLGIENNAALTACSYGLYSLIRGGGVTGSITMNNNAASGDCNNDGADLVAVTARVQFVHASPDPGLSVVDVYLNDVLVFDDFSFASATPFMDVAAGQEIQIAVADSASASAANPIAMTAVTFQTGSTYHAIAAGFTDPSLFPPNPDGLDTSFRWYITNDARETSGSPGGFTTRLFHALPDGITIDHYIVTPSPLLLRNDVAYGTFTGYDGDTPKLYTGKVTPADNPNQTLLTGVGDFSNAAGLAVQEVLIGFFGPRSSPDWPNLEWIFVYADGTVVRAPQTRTDVDDSPVGLPATFRLESNYPNPFNPSTTISYDLPRLAEATLTVYDVLGRTVRELASGTQPAGEYEVSFDAGGLPSGVYFYRLEAGGYVETKTMVVVQ